MPEINFNQNVPYGPDLVEFDLIISKCGHTIQDMTWSSKTGFTFTIFEGQADSVTDWIASQLQDIFNNQVVTGWSFGLDSASVRYDLDATDDEVELYRTTVQDCLDHYRSEVDDDLYPIIIEDHTDLMTLVWSK